MLAILRTPNCYQNTDDRRAVVVSELTLDLVPGNETIALCHSSKHVFGFTQGLDHDVAGL